MFYRPEDGHGLPHNPFNALVVPRPIGWISTRGATRSGQGGHDNLAPYSFFNAVAYTPPQVMFASTGRKEDRGDTKDSLAQIRETGVFCVNIVEAAAAEAMNRTSGPWAAGVDEFSDAGITREECRTIPCARVAGAPAALECRLTQVVTLEGRSNFLVLGVVTGIHIRDDVLTPEGRVEVTRFRPLARLGYMDYAVVSEVFQMERPG
jgi:flavin reductase (DIM6/NTAB) family NADH-FMN oxidoreductase RutF